MKSGQRVFHVIARTMFVVVVLLLLVILWLNWCLAILGLIIVVGAYLYSYRTIHQQYLRWMTQFDTLAKGVTQASSFALQNLPTAIAIIDDNGRLMWFNSVFRDWMDCDPDKTERLTALIPALRLDKIWGKSGYFRQQIGDRYYRIIYKYIEPSKRTHYDDEEANALAAEAFTAFYFDDITETENLCKRAEEATPAFGFITMDNIEDVTKGLSDIEYTNLWAEMNNVIVGAIDAYDGFIRNYSEDAYFFCVSKAGLADMMLNKFPILEKIHNLPTAKRIAPTISIGAASGTGSLRAMSEKARSGLELALGRGGDQACIYIGEEDVQFFGGRTQGSEKNTRVRARVVSQALKELMDDSSNVIIMGHEREDYDSIGGAIGVAAMAKANGMDVHIAVSDQTIAIKKLSDLFPTAPGFEHLLISPEEAEKLTTENTLVFVVDVHRPDMVAAPKALDKTKRRVVIDHHRRSSDFVEQPLLTYLEPASSSTSELVTELVQYFAEPITLNVVEASALYAGIVVDTKNFSIQTGSRTFDAASFLRRSGADISIVRHLFMDTFDSVQVRAGMMAKAERIDGMAFTDCPDGLQNASILAAQTADLLIMVEGVEASFVLYHLVDGGIGVSARSQGLMNVQLVMEALGGGGHRTVAGAQLKDMTMTEAKGAVMETARKAMAELKKEEADK